MSQGKRNTLYGFLLFLTAILLLFPYHPEQISHSDEGFYIQTPREMILTDDFLIPKYNGQYRFQKPVLYYWIVAGAYKIFGETERTARFTSTFFAALTILILFFAISRLKSEKIALLLALGIISSYGFFSLSHYAITDITLNFFIVASLLLFWFIYQRKKYSLNYVWLFFVSLSFAFLTKGPPGVIIPLLTITIFSIFSRDFRALKPIGSLSGWWIFFSIAIPWFLVLFGFFKQDYLNFFLRGESIVRFTHNHRNAIYLFASYALLITPWTLFLPLLLNFKLIKNNKFYLFLFSWILSPILFFLFIPNKHSHYLLPSVIPSIILLISLALEQTESKFIFALHKLLFFGLIVAFCISIVGLSFANPLLDNSGSFILLPFLIFAGITYLYFLRKNPSPTKISTFMAIFSLMFLFTIHLVLIPAISKRPEDGFAKKIKEEPFAKAISYRWHTKRLLYILNDRRVSFAVDDDDLERELIWPGPTYIVVDSEEYKLISRELKTKLEIIDQKKTWNKKVNASKVLSKLAKRDYDAFRAKLLLVRRR